MADVQQALTTVYAVFKFIEEMKLMDYPSIWSQSIESSLVTDINDALFFGGHIILYIKFTNFTNKGLNDTKLSTMEKLRQSQKMKSIFDWVIIRTVTMLLVRHYFNHPQALLATLVINWMAMGMGSNEIA